MITETQLLALAEALIRHHEDGAWLHAAERSRDLLASGDAEGYRTWQAIARRIEQLRPAPSDKSTDCERQAAS